MYFQADIPGPNLIVAVFIFMVLVQKSKRFESILSNWTILVLLLKKVFDQYGKRKYIQMEERGFSLAHTTIMRGVHQYGPELNERIRTHLKLTNNSWRVDETYIKIKGETMYLYRAIDSEGNTIDCYLSRKRDAKAPSVFKESLGFLSCHKSSLDNCWWR